MASGGGKLRIVVLGYVVRGPLGGLVWHHLQYLLGLRELGHDVAFLEDSDDYPSCYDPARHVVDEDPSYGMEFARQVFEQFGFERQWAYYDAHRNQWLGPMETRAVAFCESAELVLNLSGVNPLRRWYQQIPHRVLVDTDPVFTQIGHLRSEQRRDEAARHTAFFTFAENIGQPDCEVPDDGFAWQPTRQPLYPDAWELTPPPRRGPYTTVMQWDSYPAVEFDGKRYGVKADSFAPYRRLPRNVDVTLELALGSERAPRDELRSDGWRISDPLQITRTASDYQRYLSESAAEFSVAKQAYVATNSGWFSERSLGYLASGRPVIAQQTGFSRWLPTGTGLIGFHSFDEAVEAINSVKNNYDDHCDASRNIAADHFHYASVLNGLVERASGN